MKTNINRSVDSLIQIHFLNDDLKRAKTSLELECHEHFQEIRRKIDLHREKLKQKIDTIALNLIEQTNDIEAAFMNGLKDKRFEVNDENNTNKTKEVVKY